MADGQGLTIVIDARAAAEVPAGRGRLVRETLRALADRDDPHRYVLHGRQVWDESLDERFVWRLRDAPDGVWHLWSARAARRERAQAYLATNSYLSPILNQTPTVTVVYDLVAFEPGTGSRGVSWLTERATAPLAVRRSRSLLCISSATESALAARLPAARTKSRVAHLGVARALARPEPGELGDLPQPGFVLAVGTLEPRKNLPRLVRAYASLDRSITEDHPLVVVGAQGWRVGETSAALDSLGSRCQRLGHVSDGVLAELYRRCGVFAYPSVSEGFGLPVLEAMAAGAAVLTSNVSSLPEVGGDAVDYVDPRSVESIAAGLARLLGSAERRHELRRAAVARAKEFSWSTFTDTVLAELEHIARRK